jgi:signal transduction histidine kinase
VSDVAPGAAPLRFRRRLTFAFVVIAGLAAGVLAVGSFAVVDRQRHEIFERRAIGQTQIALELSKGEARAANLDALVAVSRERNSFLTLVIADKEVSSTPDFTADRLPSRLVEPGGGTRSETIDVDGAPYFVVGGDVPESPTHARLYFGFAEQSLISSLNELRNVLLVGWFVVTALSFLAGRMIAIRTLAPIQMAADAARSRAEGLLHTQLDSPSSDEFRAWALYFDDIAHALESKIQELDAAYERERRFTADVAHDLRTPLGAIVSASSILQEYLDEMPEGAKRPTELIVQDVGRLRRLVADLLEIGRLDSQKESLQIEPIDVEALLRSVLMSVRRDADVPLHLTGESRIHSDRLRIERVLANIVENAFVHGAEQDIQIAANATDNRFVVEVSDGGPGIPEDQLPHIFDRFHKAEASRSSQGSGLGLAIAAQHVASLGGTLTAENRPEGGVMFRVDIPSATVSS